MKLIEAQEFFYNGSHLVRLLLGCTTIAATNQTTTVSLKRHLFLQELQDI